MRDNTINNYFDGSQSKFLENLSDFQTQNFTVNKKLLSNEVFEVYTPKNCWKYEFFAIVNNNNSRYHVLNFTINEQKILYKVANTQNAQQLIPLTFDGVPYIQKNDYIFVQAPDFDDRDSFLEVYINFNLVIPKNT